ncbi:hypothetical protein QUF96_03120 [Bacillus bombysepticus]|nr:hypothetical protein [Bacillus bombysepticus]
MTIKNNESYKCKECGKSFTLESLEKHSCVPLNEMPSYEDIKDDIKTETYRKK